MDKEIARTLFQFYLSSIKRTDIANLYIAVVMFQFYLSSIKSFHEWDVVRLPYMFQFYLSSIKRQTISAPCALFSHVSILP